MLQQTLEGMPQSIDERREFLANNADAYEFHEWVHQFTEDELNHIKDMVCRYDEDLSDTENKKKDAMQKFKDTLDALKSTRDWYLFKYTQKEEKRERQLYKFVDRESGQVGWYDENGVLNDSREITAAESQTTIFEMKRAAGN